MESIGIFAALASAASWALGTVIFEKVGRVVPYAGITFLKGTFSILLMALLVGLIGSPATIDLRDFVILALSGVIGISIGDSLFFRSLQDLGAKVQVLYFMLGQIVTMFLSFLLLGDILTLWEYIGAFILLCGIIVVTWGKQEDRPNKKRGIIGGFISILCFSVSSIMVKISIVDIDVVTATFYRMVFGTVSVFFVGLTSKKIVSWIVPLKDFKVLGLFLFNVLVITLGGFLLSMLAIKEISVSLASVLSTTEPIFVLIFAYFVNKELATKQELVGAMIAILGLLLLVLNG